MRFRCRQKNLMSAIQNVSNIISARSTLPILSNILIEAKAGKIKFSGTDLNVGIIAKIDVSLEEEGAVAVPAKKFLDIVRELPDAQDILIQTTTQSTLSIETERLFFKIITSPKDDFPKLPEFKSQEIISLNQYLLKQMLTKTYFAISHEEARYALNGILFLITQEMIRLVATDGRRLALIQRKISPTQVHKVNNNIKVIVPTKAIQELMRILNDEGEAKIRYDKNQICFDLGNLIIITRLIDEEYPDYEKVIPKKSEQVMKIRRDRLLLAARRASIFTSYQSQAIKIDISKNRMRISKNSPELGEVSEDIDMVYNGPKLTIAMNPNYLIDVLKNLELDEIDLEFTTPEAPGVIRIGDEYIYVVLPMQIEKV